MIRAIGVCMVLGLLGCTSEPEPLVWTPPANLTAAHLQFDLAQRIPIDAQNIRPVLASITEGWRRVETYGGGHCRLSLISADSATSSVVAFSTSHFSVHKGAETLIRPLSVDDRQALLAQLPPGADHCFSTSNYRWAHYVWGAEVNTLSFCGDSDTYWVTAEGQHHARLRAVYDSLSHAAYDPVLVRVRTQPSTASPGEFALNYDGLIEVTSVAEARSPQDDACPEG